MAIPLRKGRAFTARDDAGGAPVAIINETMARRVWGDADPIGKRIRTRPTVPWITVVGVVGDIRRFARDDQPRPEMYVPMSQKIDALGADRPLSAQMRVVSKLSFAVRTAGAPEVVAEMLQREISAIDPTLAVARLSTMQGVLNQTVAPRRFVLASFGAFAALVLLLAACGTYGVMSYLVHRRTQEFGLRLALGASRGHVMWLALSQGVVFAAGGIALGLAAAVAGSRAVQSMLFRVEAIDAPSYAALTGVMLVVVLFASYLPARRALRVDPLTALRRE
jgi:predicted permease